ncbi:MAG: hypothetical protein Kow0090_23270 [Myxococcota bacterium]
MASKKIGYATLLTIILLSLSLPALADDADNYRLEIKYPEKLKIGEKDSLHFKIIPTNGYKMNEGAPLKITFANPNDGLKLEKDKLIKSDAKNPDKEPEFDNQVSAVKKGEYEIEANLSFVICTEKDCLPKRVTKVLNIKVE